MSNPGLVDAQPQLRFSGFGASYAMDPKTVVRTGFGIFYGGLESTGYYPNLGENYPFQFTDTFNAPNCSAGNCPSISDPAYGGVSLENGFSTALAAGLSNYISTPALRGSDHTTKTPYTMDWNLSVERQITNNMAATLSYVGDASQHLAVFPDPNNPLALVNSADSSQPYRPFPDFGGTAYTNYAGESSYNSLQAKLQKRMSNGMNFLVTYTYAHSLDDAPTPLGSTGDGGYRNTNLLPIRYDYSNSPWDTQHRVTVNGYYDLPFGKGRKSLNRGGVANKVAGGRAINLTFIAQTGNPFTVYPNITTAVGGGARAIPIADPVQTGGTPPPSDPGITCATKTQTLENCYPSRCSFTDMPLTGSRESVAGIPDIRQSGAAVCSAGMRKGQRSAVPATNQ